MTRREGVLALLMVTVRAMAGENSVLAQNDQKLSTFSSTASFQPLPPQSIFINLDGFKEWKVSLGGKDVTITPQEIFTALLADNAPNP